MMKIIVVMTTAAAAAAAARPIGRYSLPMQPLQGGQKVSCGTLADISKARPYSANVKYSITL